VLLDGHYVILTTVPCGGPFCSLSLFDRKPINKKNPLDVQVEDDD
jgi:hypothetical protein